MRSRLASGLRRALYWTALYLGPASLAAASVLLVVCREAFRSGPGVPTAGTTEAWGLLWMMLGSVGVGHLVSVPFGIGHLVWTVMRDRPVPAALKVAALYDVVIGMPLLALLLH